MKILITGSSGYLGNLLTKDFAKKGLRTIGLDLAADEKFSSTNYRFIKCCITDSKTLRYIVETERPTHIIHLACSFNKIRNRDKELKMDCGGTMNLLKIANEIHSVKQFIFFSSCAAYGANKENADWITEDHPLRPGEYRYGKNKKLVEEKLFGEFLRKDLKLVCLRLSSVIGPSFTKRKCAVSTIICWPFLLKQWANIKLQFLHEEDLIDVMGKIIRDSEIKGIYNLAPNSFVTVRELQPDKRYMYIPVPLLIFWARILWFLRLIKLPPESIKQSRYPIELYPFSIRVQD